MDQLASIFGTEKDKVNCSFYWKIGACRHGDKCKRKHNRPPISQTILIPHMYPNPLVTPMFDEAGNPVPIDPEFMTTHFNHFYEDVFNEMKKFGDIECLHVCDNVCEHMLGNVYVKFKTEEQAQAARTALDGRYYAGRILQPEFSPVTNFREARCRQYELGNGRCDRGEMCNFLHLKKPTKKMIYKLYGEELWREIYHDYYKYDHRKRSPSPSRYHQRKRSPSPSRYEQRKRSQSPIRYEQRKRSPSPVRYEGGNQGYPGGYGGNGGNQGYGGYEGGYGGGYGGGNQGYEGGYPGYGGHEGGYGGYGGHHHRSHSYRHSRHGSHSQMMDEKDNKPNDDSVAEQKKGMDNNVTGNDQPSNLEENPANQKKDPFEVVDESASKSIQTTTKPENGVIDESEKVEEIKKPVSETSSNLKRKFEQFTQDSLQTQGLDEIAEVEKMSTTEHPILQKKRKIYRDPKKGEW